MESVLEEVFEVESYRPFIGWTASCACDRTGTLYPSLSFPLLSSSPSSDTLFLPKDDNSAATSSSWVWTHDWLIDMSYTAVDESGWTYGLNINRLNIHLAEGTSKTRKETHHFIRRRRWIRTRVCRPPSSSNTLNSHTELPSSSSSSYAISKGSSISNVLHGRSGDVTKFLHLKFSTDDVVREGWLGKRGSFSRNWKMRYFILRRDINSLVYVKDKSSMVLLGEVHINGHTSVVCCDPPTNSSNSMLKYNFMILNGERQFRLNATDAVSRQEWMTSISEMIIQCRASFLEAQHEEDVETDLVVPVENSSNSEMTWKPYNMHCSTTIKTASANRKCYAVRSATFVSEMINVVEDTQKAILAAVDSLEANIRETVERTSTQLTGRMLLELTALRKKVLVSITEFQMRLEDIRVTNADGHECIFVLNRFKRDLFMQASSWLDALVVHAQVTLKPAHVSSPKGRIPMQWVEDRDTISCVEDDDVTLESKDDDAVLPRRVTRRPHSFAGSEGLLISNSSSSISSTSNSASVSKVLANKVGDMIHRKRLSLSSNSTHAASDDSVIRHTSKYNRRRRPSLGLELPQSLTAGHPELPVGASDLVVFVYEDYGSVIAFTLCSKAYAHELQDLQLDLLTTLRSKIAKHIDLDFAYEGCGEGSNKHYARSIAFFASQFHALRELLSPNGNMEYLESLSDCRKWATSGGKSGAGFSKTSDERFILKEIPLSEFNMLVHMAPSYFDYVAKTIEDDRPSALSKILGLYKINRSSSGSSGKRTAYVIVMQNLLVGCEVSQLYDLKGLVRRRYVENGPPPPSTTSSLDRSQVALLRKASSRDVKAPSKNVLQDGNFMDRIPVPVVQADLEKFQAAIEVDTEFLCKLGVIDYSLLLAFDEKNRQLFVGLIDYIHQYDILKKMESTSKVSITFHNPTIISPVPYRSRFIDAMQRYFVGIDAQASSSS